MDNTVLSFMAPMYVAGVVLVVGIIACGYIFIAGRIEANQLYEEWKKENKI